MGSVYLFYIVADNYLAYCRYPSHKGKLGMTKKQFRDLLIAYLTDPPYAEVLKRVGDGRFLVTTPTPGKSVFLVTVHMVQQIEPDKIKRPMR
jgi:hypothetical protein